MAGIIAVTGDTDIIGDIPAILNLERMSTSIHNGNPIKGQSRKQSFKA